MSTYKILAAVASLTIGSLALADSPGLGEPLVDNEIPYYARYAMPDGAGLPPGSGTASDGEMVWITHCATCHGATGNEGPIMPPVGPTETYAKSAGTFWPHATTLFDYIRRAMPFQAPKSLSDDEVYAVTAYILSRNNVISADLVIDADSLPKIEMPGRDKFIDLWAEQGDRPY